MNNKEKKVSQKWMRIETLSNIVESVEKDGGIPNCKKLDISKSTRLRYIKLLKDANIIQKDNCYALWKIRDKSKLKFLMEILYQKPLINIRVSQKGSRIFEWTDKRGHKFQAIIVLPKLICWNYIKKRLKYKGVKFKECNGGKAGSYYAFQIHGCNLALYERKAIIIFLQEAFGETHSINYDSFYQLYQKVIERLEYILGQKLKLGVRYQVTFSGEWEKIDTDFARYCYENGIIVKFRTANGFKYWHDFSGGRCNEEGNNPIIMDDLDPVSNTFRTVAEHREKTGKNIFDSINQREDKIEADLTELKSMVMDIKEMVKQQQHVPLNLSKMNIESINDSLNNHKNKSNTFSYLG